MAKAIESPTPSTQEVTRDIPSEPAQNSKEPQASRELSGLNSPALNNSEHANETARADVRSLAQKREALKHEVGQAKLARVEDEAAQLRDELESAKASRTIIEDRNSELEKTVRELQRKLTLNAAVDEPNPQQSRASDARDTRNGRERSQTVVGDELSQLRARVQQLDAGAKKIDTAKKEVEAQLSNSRATISRLQQEVEASRRSASQLEKDSTRTVDEIARLAGVPNDARSGSISTDQAVGQLRDRFSRLTKDYEKASTDRNAAATRVKELSNEVVTLKQDLRSSKDAVSKLLVSNKALGNDLAAASTAEKTALNSVAGLSRTADELNKTLQQQESKLFRSISHTSHLRGAIEQYEAHEKAAAKESTISKSRIASLESKLREAVAAKDERIGQMNSSYSRLQEELGSRQEDLDDALAARVAVEGELLGLKSALEIAKRQFSEANSYARETLSCAEARNAELSRNLSAITSVRDAISRDIIRLNNVVEDQRKEQETTSGKLSRAAEDIANLQQDVKDSQTAAQSFEAELIDSRARAIELEGDLKAAKIFSEKRAKEWESRCSKLQDDLKRYSGDLERAEKAEIAATSEGTRLKKQVADLRNDLKVAQTTTTSKDGKAVILQSTIQRLRDELTSAANAKNTTEAALSDLRKGAERDRASLAAVKTKLVDAANIISQLQDEREKSTASWTHEASQFKLRIERLSNDLTSANNLRNLADAQVARSTESATRFEQLAENTRQANIALKGDLDGTMIKLSNLRLELADTNVEKERLRTTTVQLKAQIPLLSQCIKQAEETSKSATQDANHLRGVLTKLRQDFASLYDAQTAFANSSRSLAEDAKARKANFEALRGELREAKKRNAQLRRDNDEVYNLLQGSKDTTFNLRRDINKATTSSSRNTVDIVRLQNEVATTQGTARVMVAVR